MYDLIIIGGGPAAITAGIYAARKKLKTLIITKDFVGQTGKAGFIENWPGIKNITGLELINQFKSHLDDHYIDTVEGELVKSIKNENQGFYLLTDKGNEYKSKSVIVASGRNPRPLKVLGEGDYLGKGISYCSICDAPLFSNKTVAVIGGGNSGFETAIEMATKYSAKKVYLLEVANKLIADETLQEEVKKIDTIKIITGAILKEVKGDIFVKALIYFDKLKKEDVELEIDGVFVEIGSVPAVDFLNGLAECDDKGEIVIDHNSCETKTPGLFAAGDVTDVNYKQIVISAGEGSKAALSAHRYLREIEK